MPKIKYLVSSNWLSFHGAREKKQFTIIFKLSGSSKMQFNFFAVRDTEAFFREL